MSSRLNPCAAHLKLEQHVHQPRPAALDGEMKRRLVAQNRIIDRDGAAHGEQLAHFVHLILRHRLPEQLLALGKRVRTGVLRLRGR